MRREQRILVVVRKTRMPTHRENEIIFLPREAGNGDRAFARWKGRQRRRDIWRRAPSTMLRMVPRFTGEDDEAASTPARRESASPFSPAQRRTMLIPAFLFRSGFLIGSRS